MIFAAWSDTEVQVALVANITGLAIAAIGAVYGSLRARKNAQVVNSVNDAVNHREPDELRLLDIVRETWKSVIEIHNEVGEVRQQIRDVDLKIDQHIRVHEDADFATLDDVELLIDASHDAA